MLTKRDIEQIVNSYIDNTLMDIDENLTWLDIDFDTRCALIKEAVHWTAKIHDLDIWFVWDCLE